MKRTYSAALGTPRTPKGRTKKRYKKGMVIAQPRFDDGSVYGISQERKVYDSATADQAILAGTITNICVPTLGSDMTNRVGRKIIMKSVSVKGLIVTETADDIATPGTEDGQIIRVMIIYDKQPNGTLPTTTDLFAAPATAPFSHMNLNNRDRFVVLSNEVCTLDAQINITTATQAQASVSNSTKLIDVYKKLNHEVIFNATNGGTIADIVSGSLLLCVFGNVPAGPGRNALFYRNARVRFVDS